MKTELNPGEQLVKSGAANLQRGAETVGGRLNLTDQRLVFESHEMNVQRGETVISLADVAETRPCWTKLFNVIPLTPNSLAVIAVDGTELRFVLNGRDNWQQAIGAARGQ